LSADAWCSTRPKSKDPTYKPSPRPILPVRVGLIWI
jgi:hypothetical protein